jgi:hypothetical protein
MTMRRLTSLTLALALALPAAALAKPAKKKAPRPRPPATTAPVIDDAPSEQATPDEPAARDDKPAEATAPPPDAAPPPTRAAAPKAAPAPAPADEAAPPAAEPAPGPSVDLQKLRAEYDRLRDELFRARSRAQLVEEGLWNARLGAQLRWKAAPDYVIRHAEVRLDGGTIWDSGDKPVTDDKLTIAERPCKPGPHAFTLRLEIRPGTKKKGKDIENLGYSSEQTFAIVVPDGKRTTVELTGDEDGSLPDYEPRIELELETETLKK